MFCKKCGAELGPEEKFCRICGAPVEVAEPVAAPVAEPPVTPVAQPIPVQPPVEPQPQPQVQPQPQPQAQAQTATANQRGNGGVIAIIIAIIASVLVVILGVVLAVVLFTNDGKSSTLPTSTDTVVEEKNDTTTVNKKKTSTYKVRFGDFSAEVPDDMIYEVNDEGLYIMDEDQTWLVMLYVGEGSFAQVKNNKASLKAAFEQDGVTAKPAEIKTYGGREYVTLELVDSGDNCIYAYSKVNAMYISGMLVLDVNGEYNYDALEAMAPVIDSITYETPKTNMENSSKTKLDTGFDLAKEN